LYPVYDIYLISFLIILTIVLLNIFVVIFISLGLLNAVVHVLYWLLPSRYFVSIFWKFSESCLLVCNTNIFLFKGFQQLICLFFLIF